MSQTSIQFLDLQIGIKDGVLVTKTFFKATDRNSFIPVDSCHHAPWLKSVPRSQMVRLRQNFTSDQEFLEQASQLRSRFLEKGYQSAELDVEVQNTFHLDREVLLGETSNRVKDKKFEPRWSFYTMYSAHHRQLKSLFNKHWDVLRSDPVLGTLLTEHANITCRGA